jgi:hypothetical protein
MLQRLLGTDAFGERLQFPQLDYAASCGLPRPASPRTTSA